MGVNNYPNVTEKTPEDELPAVEREGSLPQIRVAEPFEKIRRRTTEHALATGRYPKVLLLKRGDVKMKGARANFCFNFFGCAGFDMVEAEEYEGTRCRPDRAVQFRSGVPGVRAGSLPAR